jgi:hypothetical protein
MTTDEFEQACAALVRDAQFIALASPLLLRKNVDLLNEAREQMRLALAKAHR